jgi:hypothetical protein
VAFLAAARASGLAPKMTFDGAARIVAHDVERVLADIDADHGDRTVECLGHGACSLSLVPLFSQLRLLAGQEHGRTIPLPDLASAVDGHSRWRGCQHPFMLSSRGERRA